MYKRDKNATPLKEAIDRFLKMSRIEGRLDEINVRQHWDKMMGPAIARKTTYVRLKNGVLIISLESAVLRQELGYAKAQLANNLNKSIGKTVIKNILFN